MNRGKIVELVLGIFAVTASSVFAADEAYSSFYDDGNGFSIRVVDDMGKRTGDDLMVFTPGDSDRNPWLYVTQTGDKKKKFDGFWGLDGSTEYFKLSNVVTNGEEAWLELKNWDKKGGSAGVWGVTGRSVRGRGDLPEGRVFFRVAPEPVSAGLFLLGGLGLFGGRAFRRKRA
jgi:hypothetical protein